MDGTGRDTIVTPSRTDKSIRTSRTDEAHKMGQNLWTGIIDDAEVYVHSRSRQCDNDCHAAGLKLLVIDCSLEEHLASQGKKAQQVTGELASGISSWYEVIKPRNSRPDSQPHSKSEVDVTVTSTVRPQAPRPPPPPSPPVGGPPPPPRAPPPPPQPGFEFVFFRDVKLHLCSCPMAALFIFSLALSLTHTRFHLSSVSNPHSFLPLFSHGQRSFPFLFA